MVRTRVFSYITAITEHPRSMGCSGIIRMPEGGEREWRKIFEEMATHTIMCTHTHTPQGLSKSNQ